MFPLLETERLILREITQEDVGEVFACFSNEQVIRYYGQEKMKSVAEASAIIDFFAQSFQEVRGIRWEWRERVRKESLGPLGGMPSCQSIGELKLVMRFILTFGGTGMPRRLFLQCYPMGLAN